MRVAYQALAAVLGGCQSLHTNSMDETLALPSEHAVTLALRTQQVLAYETGVTNTVDPLGGSYFVETLTKQMQTDARRYFRAHRGAGRYVISAGEGLLPPRDRRCRVRLSRDVDAKRKLIVGVNAFTNKDEKPMDLLIVDAAVEKDKLASLKREGQTR